MHCDQSIQKSAFYDELSNFSFENYEYKQAYVEVPRQFDLKKDLQAIIILKVTSVRLSCMNNQVI